MRLFTGLMLGGEKGRALRQLVLEALGEAAPGGAVAPRPPLRVPRAADLHATLFFLGEVEPERVGEVEAALESAVRGGPPELLLDRAEAFPGRGRERILWVRASETGPPRVRELQERVSRALAALGFEPDRRAWSPHVTVARVRQGAKASIPDAFYDLAPAIPWRPAEVSLVASELRPEGARYRVHRAFPLG